jgi:hypothetical protein
MTLAGPDSKESKENGHHTLSRNARKHVITSVITKGTVVATRISKKRAPPKGTSEFSFKEHMEAAQW